MYVEHHSISVVASSSAARTYYSPVLNGRLLAVRYSTGGTMASTDAATVKNETTNETFSTKVLSAAGSWRQRLPLTTSTGGVIGYTPGEFSNERAKVSINASTGEGTLILSVG